MAFGRRVGDRTSGLPCFRARTMLAMSINRFRPVAPWYDSQIKSASRAIDGVGGANRKQRPLAHWSYAPHYEFSESAEKVGRIEDRVLSQEDGSQCGACIARSGNRSNHVRAVIHECPAAPHCIHFARLRAMAVRGSDGSDSNCRTNAPKWLAIRCLTLKFLEPHAIGFRENQRSVSLYSLPQSGAQT